MLTTIGPLHVSIGLNLGEVDAVIVYENNPDFLLWKDWKRTANRTRSGRHLRRGSVQGVQKDSMQAIVKLSGV